MQAIMETIFDIFYLIIVISFGFKMILYAENNKQKKLFGIMAIVLGFGDSFHLFPRIYAMWTTGLSENAAILGFGQMITSITMTIFYVMLYHVWRNRYNIKNKFDLSIYIYVLAAIRIIICLMPQNNWTLSTAPFMFGIYRNIPFVIMGAIIISLFYKQATFHNDKSFKFMWLAISLSFLFYIPVVLFAGSFPIVGMLMIPKTCAYVWIVFMGYKMDSLPQNN